MPIPRRRFFQFLATAALAGSVLIAAASQNQDSNAQIKFSAHAELVLLPTIVTDKAGNHITKLKKEDFTVLENGSERQISTFEEIQSEPNFPSHPSKPNEFSNLVAGSPSTRRLTLIVLDFVNTPFMAQAVGRQELLKYLKESVNSREPTALYTMTRTGLKVIHDFTTDPRILAAALHKVGGEAYEMVDSPEEAESITGTATPEGSAGGPSSLAAGANRSAQAGVQAEAARLQAMLEDAELNFQSFEQRLAITYTLGGMQQIAQALAGYPGRKSVIWASGGFPFNVSETMQVIPPERDTLGDVSPIYERTWQLLNDAQISLYPVDVKGLQVVTVPSSSVRKPGKNYARHMTWKDLDTQGTLQTFASMSGGRAYFNSNDLAKGFRDAVSDSSQYYMLGYYLDHSSTKAGWRKLTVRVKRDHTEVRTRDGFFVTNTTVDPEKTRQTDISSALLSPLDCTSLGLVAQWEKIEAAKAPGQKHINFKIRLSRDADVINGPDHNHVALDVVALTFTSEGKRVGEPVGRKIDIRLSSDKLAAIQDEGLLYRDALDLAPGDYVVRFAVRDDATGRMGSVAAPLKLE